MVRLLSRQIVVLITLRLCVGDSYGSDFTFCVDYFLFLSSSRTFIAHNDKMEYVCINGPLAQSAERGANKGKVMCSSKEVKIEGKMARKKEI